MKPFWNTDYMEKCENWDFVPDSWTHYMHHWLIIELRKFSDFVWFDFTCFFFLLICLVLRYIFRIEIIIYLIFLLCYLKTTVKPRSQVLNLCVLIWFLIATSFCFIISNMMKRWQIDFRYNSYEETFIYF